MVWSIVSSSPGVILLSISSWIMETVFQVFRIVSFRYHINAVNKFQNDRTILKQTDSKRRKALLLTGTIMSISWTNTSLNK